MVAATVRTNEVTPSSTLIESGSVSCRRSPVSPVTPLSVMLVVFPVGLIIVHALGVLPPVGTAIVFAPVVSVTIDVPAGLAVFVAVNVLSESTSPDVLISIFLYDVVLIYLIQERRGSYAAAVPCPRSHAAIVSSKEPPARRCPRSV